MKRKTLLFAISISFFFLHSIANAQDVKSYFVSSLDSLVAQFDISNADSEQLNDPVFYKLFSPTLLYESTIKDAVLLDSDDQSQLEEGELALDDSRAKVIDKILLDIYKDYPSLVTTSEAVVRDELVTSDFESTQAAPEITLKATNPLELPKNVDMGLEVDDVKPNYWRTKGSFSLNFTQNYISGNWAQGGENNRTLIAGLKLSLNYNDKKKISFENTFEAKLGFITVSGDTLHSYQTNNDMLRLESKFGYKIMNNVNLSAKMTLQTQSMPSYPTNSPDFVSHFMAPFDANFSIGFDYKREGENWDLSVYVAPLSSYNYKFVRFAELASRYGIRDGRHHKEDFGTQIQPTFNATIFKNVTLNTRLEFYTNYARAYFNWENTIKMKINKYLDTTLFMHGRFDDSSRGLYSQSYGYWQFKEYFALGLSYSW
ncbi:MAG: DUF3078 domain-containing protein [Bacteroidaceae bacterium]|nr:DUF3078 domain-containing protein [Bacteroidaceae bacterium]